VARLSANAAPRAIVRIIDCFLIVGLTAPSRADRESAAGRKLAIEHDKDNDGEKDMPFMLLNGVLMRCKSRTQKMVQKNCPPPTIAD
jgi:hypothetical protein